MLQEYNKIQSLYKRQDFVKGAPRGSHGPLLIGEYSEPEFGNIKLWHVEEKVDGTNIRVVFERGTMYHALKEDRTRDCEDMSRVTFAGRSNDAQIPPHLLAYLQSTFTVEELDKAFPDKSVKKVILFGEGYGPKIQSGGKYRDNVGFILFDVFVGSWVLMRSDNSVIASALQVPMCPTIGIMTEEQIVNYVKSKPDSLCSVEKQTMEGVVCRSSPLMLFRNGKPMMWKLKCKEFD